jgi:hypothetical protein
MSLLKQINDKGAVVEWCPLAEHGNLVALGTKVMIPILHISSVICFSRTLLALVSMTMAVNSSCI